MFENWRMAPVVGSQDRQEEAPVGHRRDVGAVLFAREATWRSRLLGGRVDLVATRSVYRIDVSVVSRLSCNVTVLLQSVNCWKTCGAGIVGIITAIRNCDEQDIRDN